MKPWVSDSSSKNVFFINKTRTPNQQQQQQQQQQKSPNNQIEIHSTYILHGASKKKMKDPFFDATVRSNSGISARPIA
jgi:hypothetical protein